VKKLLLLALLVCFSVAAYSNRFHLYYFLYSHVFHRPEKISFVDFEAGRVHIFYVKSAFFDSRIHEIARNIAADLEEAESEVGVKLPSGITVYLYNNWEEKGNNIRDIRLASADLKDDAIHCIVNQQFNGLRERAEYALLIRTRYGDPWKPEFARFAAAALGGVWNQKTLNEWAQFLTARNLYPSFPALLNDSETLSEFITYPWSSLLMRFLREKYGLDAMARFYNSGQLPSAYENPWKQYVTSLQKHRDFPAPPYPPEFQRGVSYAFSNGWDGGYGAKKSGESLDELKKIGVEWVAAIPYGFMESHDATRIHYAGHMMFGESDESMAALTTDAKARGMKVMLKPQIWIDHDSWPGKIDFDSPEAWQTYMQNYDRWITHYAILAELTGADLLCVGTEMVETTLKNPERWREIVSHVRQVYHGPLVYAANYGKEFEGIIFWDALDYIGLDNYYPVRSSTDQGVGSMRVAFQQQREKLKAVSMRFGRPLIFTEIGYMANEAAGMGSVEAENSNYSEERQAECYRLALETYWDQPWFYGMYWWKWFSDVSDRGRDADRHSPHGRAAEKVMKEWYKRRRS
jgi:hypothetical protein